MSTVSDKPFAPMSRRGASAVVSGFLSLIRFPDNHFRKPYHEPARRLSEAGFRIAKRSSGNRMRRMVRMAATALAGSRAIVAAMKPFGRSRLVCPRKAAAQGLGESRHGHGSPPFDDVRTVHSQ
ncbi:hypothetical protein [Methylobacterium sp. ID0610]|uniref:hypothetical protein n=1 Tax=Methylobacterium carpenticola TaxID=3344827 RepID=UPI0036D43169